MSDAAPAVYAAPTTQQMTAVIDAVRRLEAAGMVLRYKTAYGHSYYMGWPGKFGLLRVSDHRAKNQGGGDIWAKLTFSSEACRNLGREGEMEKKIATALGFYMLRMGSPTAD